jgi:hypothetical protein
MKRNFSAAAIFCLFFCYVPDALAIGFGYYGTLGKGRVKYDNWGETSREDANFIGAGFVLDTAVALDRAFNYRLNVGYEKLSNDFDRLESIVIDQDFGLAVYQSANTRIWIGPELRIFFSDDEYGIGIGPVLGINLHTGRSVSTALKLGFLISDFAGGGWVFSSDYEKESHAFINLAILFRSARDRY